ncbi:MAG TPA: hypothetical protein VGH98_18165 [Gemmatimonadaceae bacterium]
MNISIPALLFTMSTQPWKKDSTKVVSAKINFVRVHDRMQLGSNG